MGHSQILRKEGEIASVRRTRPNVLPFENGCKYAVKVEKRACLVEGALSKMAEPTGLEPIAVVQQPDGKYMIRFRVLQPCKEHN